MQVIVDEGTSALDAKTARQFAEELVKDAESTVIFITHSADSKLLDLFTKTIDLNQGKFLIS